MNELLKLIESFQVLGAKTGRGKTSSYQLTISFEPDVTASNFNGVATTLLIIRGCTKLLRLGAIF